MATSLTGAFQEFDETTERWNSYTERFEFFVLANGVADEKKVATFLSVMGAKTYGLLRSLIQLANPGSRSYSEICADTG